MSKKMDKIIKLNDLVSESFHRKHIIVLEPNEKYERNSRY